MDEIIAWMNANPNLSGWAQTVGALLALLVAVWIPRQQARALAIERANLDYQKSMLLFLVLNDMHIWATGVVQLQDLPPREIRNDLAVTDFLDRLRELELQGLDPLAVTAAYSCRATLLRMHHRFSVDGSILRITPQVKTLLAADLATIRTELAFSRLLKEKAASRRDWVKSSLIGKPVVLFLYHTPWGRWVGQKMAGVIERQVERATARHYD